MGSEMCIRDRSKMNKPVGFTINFHKYRKFKINNKWQCQKLSLPNIEDFWNILCGNLLHYHYSSSQRKKFHTSTACFANVDIGLAEEMVHLHGVANNISDNNEMNFRWVIRQCISNAHRITHIVSGDPHIDTRVLDNGWIDYVFKRNGLCYPLYGR